MERPPPLSLSLTMFSDWKFCSACGLPPSTKKEKLLTCGRCKTAAYHNADCQKNHWNSGHKRDCKRLAEAIRPLQELSRVWNRFQTSCNNADDVNKDLRSRLWWDLSWRDFIGMMTIDGVWKDGETQWNDRKDYLAATGTFQRALKSLRKHWDIRTGRKKAKPLDERDYPEDMVHYDDSDYYDDGSDTNGKPSPYLVFGIQTARKLLFSAYCLSDGNRPQEARINLVQCISILLECSYSYVANHSPQDIGFSKHCIKSCSAGQCKKSCCDWKPGQPQEFTPMKEHIAPLLNDAWMELMLSYEMDSPCQDIRRISRHVAHMAIQSSCGNTLFDCLWKDPLQRPGYMSPLKSIPGRNMKVIVDPPFVSPEDHPNWCRKLEANWKEIAKELSSLQQKAARGWTEVGSGDRGSGGDDHRVVSAGGKWTEYVLFGTGAPAFDMYAPFTKQLIQNCVPDAVSLAEDGGGEVIFSRLAPNTRIGSHCGPTNFRWTAHLGLVIPSNSNISGGDAGDAAAAACGDSTTTAAAAEEPPSCGIKIADKWHQWEAGKMLVFDDSYEHEIRNDTDETRIVLLLRFWHPGVRRSDRENESEAACEKKEEAHQKRYEPPYCFDIRTLSLE